MIKVNPFPEDFHSLQLKRFLSDMEFEKVKNGLTSWHQDSRWHIYFKDGWLYFHRTWTRNCIYKMHITESDSGPVVDKVLINGDLEQYKYVAEDEPKHVLEILNLFLESKI